LNVDLYAIDIRRNYLRFSR